MDNEDEKITSEENLEKVEMNENFNGYFHERDSLSENNIVDEVKSSFLEYSMSVIASRALPDLRDGLKPVQKYTFEFNMENPQVESNIKVASDLEDADSEYYFKLLDCIKPLLESKDYSEIKEDKATEDTKTTEKKK